MENGGYDATVIRHLPCDTQTKGVLLFSILNAVAANQNVFSTFKKCEMGETIFLSFVGIIAIQSRWVKLVEPNNGAILFRPFFFYIFEKFGIV
jgi:hypothetical protein